MKLLSFYFIRSHGVGKMFQFDKILPSHSVSQMIYFIHPSLINIKTVSDHVHNMKLQDQPPLQ